MIQMRYTANGATQSYTFPNDRTDEVLDRADKKFLPPLTADDEARFQDIYNRMMEIERKKRRK